MELFLNLLWLLIAVTLLATWRMKWIHERRGSLRHRLQEWSAVSLALVLLFFAVSMTDDMHCEIVALVEGSGNKKQQIGSSAGHLQAQPPAAVHSTVWALPAAAPLMGRDGESHDVVPSERSPEGIVSRNAKSSRAPPVSLL